MTQLKKTISRYAGLIIFMGMMMVGLWVYRDYGVSVDESAERMNDILSYIEMNQLLFNRTPDVFKEQAMEFDLDTYADKYYGVAIRFPLMLAEDIHYGISGEAFSNRDIYLIRHLYVWLIYYFALVSFYCLIRRLFESNWIAVAGVLMIFLFGRFFANSFYDVKDIVFASLMMYSLSCAERVFATKRKPKWCILFAIVSAFAVTSRVVGAILDVLMIGMFLWQDIAERYHGKKQRINIISYILICCSFPIYILLSPVSWRNPIAYSMGVMQTFSNYTFYPFTVYFNGQLMRVNLGGHGTNPWNYTVHWMILTVPLVVLGLGLSGAVSFLLGIVRKRTDILNNAKDSLLWMTGLLFAGTIVYQILCRPVMYNSWRHSYFLYPLLVVFSTYALYLTKLSSQRVIKTIAVGSTVICLLYQMFQIVSLHPFEMVSMNPIGQMVADEYEGDYWGLSGKQAIEWVLSQDDDQHIKIYGLPLNSGPGLFIPSTLSLKEEDAARVQLAFLQYNPKYFITTDREYEVPEHYKLVKTFTVYDDVPVCVIYARETTEES